MLVSGNKKFGIVGVNAPPNDSTTTVHIMVALEHFPQQRKVILVVDLKLDLDYVE